MIDTSNFNWLWLVVWGAVPFVGWASVWLYNKRETPYEKRLRSLVDDQVDEIVAGIEAEAHKRHDFQNCWMCKQQRDHGIPDWVNR